MLSIAAVCLIVGVSRAGGSNTASDSHASFNNVSKYEGAVKTVESSNSNQNTEHTQPSTPAAGSSAHPSTTNSSPANPSSTNTSTTKVTVNGKTITVPANGSYDRSYSNDGTQTSIHVNNQQQSSSSTSGSSNNSSSNIHISVQTDSPPE